jgi:hypothetical protein
MERDISEGGGEGEGERGASHLSIFMGLEPAVENTQQQDSLYPPAEIDIQVDIELSSLPTSRDRYTGRYRALYPSDEIDIQVDIELSLSLPTSRDR